MAPFPGSRIGSLRLVARTRQDGSGDTWRARREGEASTLAVQTLRSSSAAALRPVVGLAHPNLRTLHDVGSEHGYDYLVLETLSGETLAERLGRSTLPLDEVLDVATGAAAGLEALHRAGVVHGNLDPEKIFLAGGTAKLVDFGLGRTLRSYVPTAPRVAVPTSGDLGPSFGYLSPEEDRGEPVDPRSDVFSFGAILDEMVSGPIPIAEQASPLPAALRAVIGRCLAADPAERYAGGSELRIALEDVAAEKLRYESSLRARFAWRRRRIAAVWTIAAGIGFAMFFEDLRSPLKTEPPHAQPAAGTAPAPRVASSDLGEEPLPAMDRAAEGQVGVAHGAGE